MPHWVRGDGWSQYAVGRCLRPCSLAPAVRVWPEGTVYGGVDQGDMARIIAEHLLADGQVADLAYLADGRKHLLRSRG